MAFSCGTYGAVSADGTEYDGNFADKVTVEQLMDFHKRRLMVRAFNFYISGQTLRQQC